MSYRWQTICYIAGVLKPVIVREWSESVSGAISYIVYEAFEWMHRCTVSRYKIEGL